MRVIERCRELAQFTEEPGRITRTYLSEPMHDVHRVVGGWMCEAGMEVWVDAVGNIRGLYGDPRAPRLLIGSHLDTVPDAGAFDGILGVVMGIEFCKTKPKASLEVIGFSEEEGVRFVIPFIGSRAVVGTLDEKVIETISPAIRNFGLDPAEIPQARFAPESTRYVEFHIEQGPVLEAMDLPVAAVEAIVGQTRLTVNLQNKANHAGTTPMHLRHDPVAAVAEWIVAVESHAKATPGLVATVGSLNVSPNVGNVIAGEVRATLDVRHAVDSVRQTSVAALLSTASEICARRGVGFVFSTRMDQPAVPLDTSFWKTPLHRMTSGAGHDAMIVAPYLPTSMLFLRSPGGISHHPDETVLAEDVEAAFACMIL